MAELNRTESDAPPTLAPSPALTQLDWGCVIGMAALVVLPVAILPNIDERWSTTGLAMIPAVLARPDGVTSLGCIGNRVYTGLGDDELYFTIPGSRVGDVVERLETVLHANRELERYHQGRRAAL